MALFGKKQEEEVPSLPELPEINGDIALPSIDDLPEIPKKLPEIQPKELPSLPDLTTAQQAPAIKQEIIETKPKIISPIGMQKSNFEIEPQIIEAPQKQIDHDLPKTIEVEPVKPRPLPPRPTTKKAEPIYVRLDKFETTVETFEEIKDKINEIEKFLQKTKEIKQKEEEELLEWEREIQMIKTRIDSIDKNIFNKLD